MMKKKKILSILYVVSLKWSLIKLRTEKLYTIISEVLHNTCSQNHKWSSLEGTSGERLVQPP